MERSKRVYKSSSEILLQFEVGQVFKKADFPTNRGEARYIVFQMHKEVYSV